jgi:hypothetical protein
MADTSDPTAATLQTDVSPDRAGQRWTSRPLAATCALAETNPRQGDERHAPGARYRRPLMIRGSISMNTGRLPAAHGTRPSSCHSVMTSCDW